MEEFQKSIVLHLDMDAFFAQIEERENPGFRGKPLVVGADPKKGKGRGVVSTANYEARKYGIKSALPISRAYQLCPEAVFLPPNIDFYQKVSESIMKTAEKYSSLVEKVSIDEAYLDMGRAGTFEKAEKLALNLKKEIFRKEKLKCTAGIGPNKLVAKLATNQAKPDGLLAVKENEVSDFLAPKNVLELPGIGPKTAEALRKLGVEKVEDLRKLSREKLESLFGKAGGDMYLKARGISEDPVSAEEETKSVGRDFTFGKDTRDPEIVFSAFEKMLSQVFSELKEKGFSFKTITVVCRFSGFETHSKSKTLKEASEDRSLLGREAKKLLLRFLMERKKDLRMIGLRVLVDQKL